MPRLLLTHRAGALSPAQRRALDAAVGRPDLDEFLREVLGIDDGGTLPFVRRLLDRGVSVEAVYLDLLAPTARALGTLWESDTCDFVEVTIALGRLQHALRALSRTFINGPATTDGNESAGRALLCCIPGEQHTLGLFIVAEFMIRDGWGVSVGPPLLEADLLQLVRDEWFDVVGFSVACDSRLSQLRREIGRVRAASRNRRVGVLVGGRVFNDRPELVARVGADASAADARGVSAQARLVAARRSERPCPAGAAGDG